MTTSATDPYPFAPPNWDGKSGLHQYLQPEYGTFSHDNKPREGYDLCPCGCKYWDGDRCHSCGETYKEDQTE